ncbi:MAG: GDP-mannose 4,6-dehydratase [Ilumatobacteraceae bacterium]
MAVAQSARFFLVPTSEVYGDPLVHPQPETYWGNVDSIGPRSCYDEAKRFSEALSMAYHRSRGADIRIVRIFNTYGPRMKADDGRVVTNFVVQALQGDPITLYGDGEQTRSFCYVADQVAGQLALLDSDITTPVNIGNPDEFTMRELAEVVVELTGSNSEIVRPAPARTSRRSVTALPRQLGGRRAARLEADHRVARRTSPAHRRDCHGTRDVTRVRRALQSKTAGDSAWGLGTGGDPGRHHDLRDLAHQAPGRSVYGAYAGTYS